MFTLNKDGWIEDAQHYRSPFYNNRPCTTTIQLLVIHGISLPAEEFGSNDIIDLFLGQIDITRHPSYGDLANLKVSAHFLIRRDGALLQFVSCDDVAWHAGVSSWRGQSQCNQFSIGIELEGSDSCAYEKEQYAILTTLINTLKKSYPTLSVTGHCHIAPARKTDPGPHFLWDSLFASIGRQCDGRTAS